MVQIKRTWETIHFTALVKGTKVSQSVELTINHHEKTYCISSESQDQLLSLKGKSITELDLKFEAIKAAINYTKNNLK